jgi:hypothetical protein
MEVYDKLRKVIDSFNQHWRDGTLKSLGTKLPEIIHENKKHTISDVKLKNDELYVRYFTGLYSRWKLVNSTDEIIFNEVNFKIL